jgi:hypothetical protein
LLSKLPVGSTVGVGGTKDWNWSARELYGDQAPERGVDLMTEKTKSENPALEPEAEAKILARKTLELLRL